MHEPLSRKQATQKAPIRGISGYLLLAALGMTAVGFVASTTVAVAGWIVAVPAACVLVFFGLRESLSSRAPVAEIDPALKYEIGLHRRIFETSIDLILVTDRRGQIIEVSPSAKATIGYEPQEMIGRTGSDFIYPDDLDPTRIEMRLARRGREMRNFECRYVHKDGRVIPLNWTGVWSETEQRHFFIGRDITQQKELENAQRIANETLAAVIDASPVAIVCLSADQAVTVWSRAAENTFGYGAREVVGRPCPLVPEDDKAEFDALFRRVLGGEILRNIRIAGRRKDGNIIDVSFDAAPMTGPDGVNAIALALTDITERNALERQLQQAQKMDAIGQLTGGVAHDFNNMLSVITGTIDILAEAVADRPEMVAIAKLISEAADRGAELTGRLLAFARKQPLQPRAINTNETVTEVAKLLQPTLGEQIDIEWKLRPDAWPALVDPTHLMTALLNLAVNARDAMTEGGQLTLETDNVYLDEDYAAAHSEVTPGAYVMFAVSDTGPGIPPDIRDKVFEPFFTTKGVGKGTGLGLSMVYGFAKQSGGHIKLYSEEGQGTTFKIYLPRATSEHEQAGGQTAPGSDALTGTETILVVEDDPIVLRSATAQLASLGYRTITAGNAAETLAIVDSGAEFDLLFTDLIMPGSMNGSQLAKEVARRRPSLKVLFTSGYTRDAVVHHGRLEAGVLLLPKPYHKSELARMIRRALDGGIDLPARDAGRIAAG